LPINDRGSTTTLAAGARLISSSFLWEFVHPISQKNLSKSSLTTTQLNPTASANFFIDAIEVDRAGLLPPAASHVGIIVSTDISPTPMTGHGAGVSVNGKLSDGPAPVAENLTNLLVEPALT